jgi:hypothetical protein
VGAFALSRAADASWRHFAPVSTGAEDYIESHPVAEAARILFYQRPASARWVFDALRASRGER